MVDKTGRCCKSRPILGIRSELLFMIRLRNAFLKRQLAREKLPHNAIYSLIIIKDQMLMLALFKMSRENV